MCQEYWSVPLVGVWGILCKLNFFAPCFCGWLNIADVKGKSNNTLGVWSLLPDPSGTKLHQSELRMEVKPGCSHIFIAVIQNVELISVWKLHMRGPSVWFFFLVKKIDNQVGREG